MVVDGQPRLTPGAKVEVRGDRRGPGKAEARGGAAKGGDGKAAKAAPGAGRVEGKVEPAEGKAERKRP